MAAVRPKITLASCIRRVPLNAQRRLQDALNNHLAVHWLYRQVRWQSFVAAGLDVLNGGDPVIVFIPRFIASSTSMEYVS